MTRITVAGIGCRHLGDDSIGLCLVEGLRGLPPGVRTELWEDADALTLALRLLECTGPVLLVDCADMGLSGGKWRCFRMDGGAGAGERAGLVLRSRTLSTHGLGLAEAVGIAMRLGSAAVVHVFGIQPACTALRPRPGEGLSPVLEHHLPALRTALRRRIDALYANPGEEA